MIFLTDLKQHWKVFLLDFFFEKRYFLYLPEIYGTKTGLLKYVNFYLHVIVPGNIAVLISILSSDNLFNFNLKSSVETDTPGLVNIFLLRRFEVLLIDGDESFK